MLSLPPMFAVYDRVDLTSCEAQVEKRLAKLRWATQRTTGTEVSASQQDGLTTQVTTTMIHGTVNQQEGVRMFNEETKTLDLRLLKPTDLPFNNRVFLPAPLDNEKEVTIQHLRDRLSRIT